MDLKKLQRVVIDALEDVKAQDIKVFDTTPLTGLFDRVVIASATSNRQSRALAASVRDKVKERGGQVISVEGEESAEWVLVDSGDVVVHVMQPAVRSYYNLEELWAEGKFDRPGKLTSPAGEASRAARAKPRVKPPAKPAEGARQRASDERKPARRRPRDTT